MHEAVIVSAVRTAIAKSGGVLSKTRPEVYGAEVVKEAVKRAGVDPMEIGDVIFGNCQNGGGNMGRLVSLMAGMPIEIPGFSLHRACGSGMTVIHLAAQAIMAGTEDVLVVGGTESMTLQPYLVNSMDFNAPNGAQFRRAPLLAAPEEIGNPSMGMTAENLAEKYQISRVEQDQFALLSQQKMAKAMNEGLFKEQIVPLTVQQGKTSIVFDTDDYPRPETNLESLAKLKPVFKKDGSVTAGNSSGVVDAASALVMMSAEKAKSLGLKPLMKIRAFATVGVDPNIMGIGPVPATRKALKIAGLSLDDIDLIELNEAFAAQLLSVDRELKLDMSKVNVNGGAIAHGHPIGATGCILATKLAYELNRRDLQFGLITACIGGGQGVATIVERV